MNEGKNGLWANIHAKRQRIKNGSGERMRKPGSKGAPTAADFRAAQNEEVEEIETDDYKLSKSGRKIRAHRIVFNKGEDDGKKGVTEQMKKTYKDFVEQHTPDLTEEQKNELVAELQEVLGKDDPAGKWISDFVHSDNPKFAGKSKEKRKQMALAAYYANQRKEEVEIEEELKGKQHKLDKNKNGKLDAHDFKLLRKEEQEIEESVFDWKNKARETSDKSTTMTKHDVKKTSTGTVYTKQRDADGMSKEFKRDNEPAQKRGRGRPKKNSFGEAVEFLMNLDEETFDSFMEDGFDAFMEHYEQLDEISKATLGSYAKKASADAASHSAKAQRSMTQAQDAKQRAKDPKLAFARSGNETLAKSYSKSAEKSGAKAEKRLSGVNKAVERLTK